MKNNFENYMMLYVDFLSFNEIKKFLAWGY